MATIDSVSLYLSRSSNRTGWYIHVDIRDIGEYTDNPTLDALLGSKTILVDNVPTHASKNWVTFTFDTPIEISDTGFYSVHAWCDTTDYQAAGLYWYESDGWNDAITEEPYVGKERFWTREYLGSWTAGGSGAYKVNCTGCDDNTAESPLSTYNRLTPGSSSYGKGVRTYLEAAMPPEKPINPTPADKEIGVPMDAVTASWEDGGAGQENAADSYDVYYATLSGFLSLVAEDITKTQTALVEKRFSLSGGLYYWRVDAKNEVGITQGDVWTFTTLFSRYFPPERRSDYNEDAAGLEYETWIEDQIWDIESQAWTDDANYLASGGGRYKNHIIAVGHGVVYYGDA